MIGNTEPLGRPNIALDKTFVISNMHAVPVIL